VLPLQRFLQALLGRTVSALQLRQQLLALTFQPCILHGQRVCSGCRLTQGCIVRCLLLREPPLLSVQRFELLGEALSLGCALG